MFPGCSTELQPGESGLGQPRRGSHKGWNENEFGQKEQ
jgi:hypothetical protein